MMRRVSKVVRVAGIPIGGGNPVVIQSMLGKPPTDIEGNLEEAWRLEAAGCQIVRVAVPDLESVRLIALLKETVHIPVVADIHFDYKLALESAAAGVDKIRINPGNIGSDDKVKAVADTCREKGIPIRIGVNSGSVEKHILAKYGHPVPEALVDSALYHASLLERFDFHDILISMKSQDVPSMIAAYRNAADRCEYPLHLGVTHTGTARMGLIKSAMGIGALLVDGIGDTLRVSLAADPVEEIRAAKEILRASGATDAGVDIIACPTCGRTTIDVIRLADQVYEALKDCETSLSVAVMGCPVNGPGEAREADLGVSGGNGTGILFAKGKVLKKVPEDEILPALLEQVAILRREREEG
ncbi:flavodoxin-dependent (E)-4-hydroxy-3-methylbut-2-enyl-diphosphate synthase [Ruminococcaceae bacterium OttesenSCG-928-L11]|nr:flavodoxin-dependent (E)-4-hydroxy-3-methylbut-2-enyl-diphosphate synthase [Ruminococcaceae bacterium OttesenSCG-928-L11]